VDSRANNFNLYAQPDALEVQYLILRGVRIEDLHTELLHFISGVPVNRRLIVKICAGVNNLLVKSRHSGGLELKPDYSVTAEQVFKKCAAIKTDIINSRPGSLVGLIISVISGI
jgi:hypothetical protein